eukprot:Gregarina_sp_Poly_1__8487@NODE_4_length_26097_cov_247_784211_g3_i0_p3_GENE_NODE_4_length_26097_cov_247_784211_g3_i0NODE_4_length_26097_cov_247_784211_g3_i0_p3_ORF_typecomplete_len783_score134_57zfCCCH/PF00642_24/3_9e03zfCCCH/PF00642_24/3_3e07zfCCCH_4/PF18044_1/3_8e03zfCCCH_4/PF18044_1/0_0019zf_CCCH_4/PF18345_1/2_2e03zf_CCCH_4/PF18345_1/0_0021zfCCCH_3/PF15663_5/0_11_NODE_4_length_26097_cov_247_784211_g3_i01484517193
MGSRKELPLSAEASRLFASPTALPNINIALPPPPPSQPPTVLSDPANWPMSRNGPENGTTSESALTDQLLLLLNKHKADADSDTLFTPPSAEALRVTTIYGTDGPSSPPIKSAGWLDRLMSGSTQDVFSEGFRAADPSFLPVDVFSDLPAGGQRPEQPPSPLQKFHSWQQGAQESTSRLASDQCRFPYLESRAARGEEGLRDILGMLADRAGRERAASLPHADPPPRSPSPQYGNALQVPEMTAPNRLWGSAENLTFGEPDFHRRLQQAASMELQRNSDIQLGDFKTPPLSPPPPPKSRRAPAKGWWKTEVCKFWKEGTGCRNGTNCRWAHGDQELRRMDANPSPRDAEALSLSPGGPAAWSHERLLMDPLPRPSVSPSMAMRMSPCDEPVGLSSQPSLEAEPSKWVALPIQYLARSHRARTLEETWQLIRMKNLSCLSLAENVLIASSPGINATSEYWEDLLTTMSGTDPEPLDSRQQSMGLKKCILCGGLDPSARETAISSNTGLFGVVQEGQISIVVACDRCMTISENKAQCLNLFPPDISSYDSDDRSTHWGFKLAQFMRACEDGSWVLRTERGNILGKGQSIDPWIQHQRYVARMAYVFFLCFRNLEGQKKFNYQTMQLLEGLSLVEWTAVAHQPALFAILLLSSFPINKLSVPATLTSLAVSLESWRPSHHCDSRSPFGFSFSNTAPRPRFLAPPHRPNEQPSSASSSAASPGLGSSKTNNVYTALGTPSKRSAFSSTSPTGSATPMDADFAAGNIDEILLGRNEAFQLAGEFISQ